MRVVVHFPSRLHIKPTAPMRSLLPVLFTVVLLGPCELAAQRQASLQPAPEASDTPITLGTRVQIYSEEMGEQRTFSIYVPATYADSQARYPVLYVLDGEAYFLHAASTATSLAQLGRMPEAIVVAIHNTNRRRDLTPPFITLPDVPAGGAEAFLSFIEKELIPIIEGRYRTQPLRILIGHSHGGLFNSYALIARPSLFRWHLALDAPVHLNSQEMERRVETFLADHPDHVGRLVTIEKRFGWSDAGWENLVTKAPPAFRTTRLSLPEETHQSLYVIGMYEGLKKLFYDAASDNTQLQTLDELIATYSSRSSEYGYPVPIPKQILLDFAEENLFVGQPQRARPLLDKVIALYGTSPQTQRLEAWLSHLIETPLQETSEDLLNTPSATPQAMAPFLGTWEGLLRGTIPVKVTFTVQEGVVSGRTIQTFPNGHEGVFEHVMARVSNDGVLEWGYMNKTRPYSLVLAYQATLSDANTLHVKGKKTLSPPPGRDLGDFDTPFTLSRKRE